METFLLKDQQQRERLKKKRDGFQLLIEKNIACPSPYVKMYYTSSSIPSKRAATIYGCIALLFWAPSGFIGHELKKLPPFQILMIVCCISFFAFLIKVLWTRKWKYFFKPKPIWVPFSLLLTINQICFIQAHQLGPPHLVVLINYLWPTFVLIFFKNINPASFFAVSLGFLGVAIGFYDSFHWRDLYTYPLSAYMYALFAAITWALFSLLCRQYEEIPNDLMGLGFGFSGLFFTFAHWATNEPLILPNFYECFLLVGLGLFVQAIAYAFWNRGMKHGYFQQLGLISYFTPIFSLSILMTTGRSPFSVSLLIAGCFVVLANLIPTFLGKKIRFLLPSTHDSPVEANSNT